MTLVPSRAPSLDATARAMTSVLAPGAKGTMILISCGRVACWANATGVSTSASAAKMHPETWSRPGFW